MKDMDIKVKWCFPSNNGGTEFGLRDSLIETFNDNPLKSLAREICQNSLDAAHNNKTVVVEFKTFSLNSSDFPDIEHFKDVIQRCKDFVKDSSNKRAYNFFDNAGDLLEKNRISFLRISDFNTTGLRGSDKERRSDWTNLVKTTGSSEKDDVKGGSFGIGKGAPFACSDLRTVFYSTLDIDGLTASQGVSRLISFKLPEANPDGSDKIAQGIGYYGVSSNYNIFPIRSMLNLDSDFTRTTPGTDIYIAGLRKDFLIDESEFQTTIINEILDSFMIAIFKGKLEVAVNNVKICKDTLDDIIISLNDKITYSTKLYYELLTSEKTQWSDLDIKIGNYSLGNIHLGINIRYDGNNKIAMIRSSGMKIMDKDRLCQSLRFVGMALIEGDKLNSWLKEIENPSHNKWEPNRYKPNESKELLKKIYDTIKNYLNEQAEKTINTTVDIEGASDFLPDVLNEEGNGERDNNTVESLNRIINVEVKVREKADDSVHLATEEPGSDIQSFADSEGEVAETGDLFSYFHLGGNEHREGERNGIPVGEGDGIEAQKLCLVKAKQIRIYCFDKAQQKYKLIITPTESTKKGYIELNKVAEISEKMPVKVVQAKCGDKNINCYKNRIGYMEFEENQQIKLDVSILSEEYSAMEVKIYAYKG
jgi:hypothetical protein